MKFQTIFALFLALPLHAGTQLTKQQAQTIGQRIFRNECGGKKEKLLWWGPHEEFPSLGIGHFIWYPEGAEKKFTQTFPALLSFLKRNGVKLPSWLIKTKSTCPWKSREEFLAARPNKHMNQLQHLLETTFDLQTRFIIQQLEKSLPKMLKASTNKRNVKKQWQRLHKTPQGTFALIDYLNFKGAGTNERERYHEQGWGLLQVLENMQKTGSAVENFVETAEKILTKRVHHSPPERQEKKYLIGWKKRIKSYFN